MKQVRRVRFLFQCGVLLAFLMVFGTLGAFETGMLNPLQFVLQLAACTRFGLFCLHMSRRRFFIRIYRTRRRQPAKKRSVRREAALRAA